MDLASKADGAWCEVRALVDDDKAWPTLRDSMAPAIRAGTSAVAAAAVARMKQPLEVKPTATDMARVLCTTATELGECRRGLPCVRLSPASRRDVVAAEVVLAAAAQSRLAQQLGSLPSDNSQRQAPYGPSAGCMDAPWAIQPELTGHSATAIGHANPVHGTPHQPPGPNPQQSMGRETMSARPQRDPHPTIAQRLTETAAAAAASAPYAWTASEDAPYSVRRQALPLYCLSFDEADSFADADADGTSGPLAAAAAAAAAVNWSALSGTDGDASDDCDALPACPPGSGQPQPQAEQAATCRSSTSLLHAAACGGAAPEGGTGAAAAAGSTLSTACSSRAVDRYSSLLMSSAGWRCTEFFDMYDMLLLSRLEAQRSPSPGGARPRSFRCRSLQRQQCEQEHGREWERERDRASSRSVAAAAAVQASGTAHPRSPSPAGGAGFPSIRVECCAGPRPGLLRSCSGVTLASAAASEASGSCRISVPHPPRPHYRADCAAKPAAPCVASNQRSQRSSSAHPAPLRRVSSAGHFPQPRSTSGRYLDALPESPTGAAGAATAHWDCMDSDEGGNDGDTEGATPTHRSHIWRSARHSARGGGGGGSGSSRQRLTALGRVRPPMLSDCGGGGGGCAVGGGVGTSAGGGASVGAGAGGSWGAALEALREQIAPRVSSCASDPMISLQSYPLAASGSPKHLLLPDNSVACIVHSSASPPAAVALQTASGTSTAAVAQPATALAATPGARRPAAARDQALAASAGALPPPVWGRSQSDRLPGGSVPGLTAQSPPSHAPVCSSDTSDAALAAKNPSDSGHAAPCHSGATGAMGSGAGLPPRGAARPHGAGSRAQLRAASASQLEGRLKGSPLPPSRLGISTLHRETPVACGAEPQQQEDHQRASGISVVHARIMEVVPPEGPEEATVPGAPCTAMAVVSAAAAPSPPLALGGSGGGGLATGRGLSRSGNAAAAAKTERPGAGGASGGEVLGLVGAPGAGGSARPVRAPRGHTFQCWPTQAAHPLLQAVLGARTGGALRPAHGTCHQSAGSNSSGSSGLFHLWPPRSESMPPAAIPGPGGADGESDATAFGGGGEGRSGGETCHGASRLRSFLRAIVHSKRIKRSASMSVLTSGDGGGDGGALPDGYTTSRINPLALEAVAFGEGDNEGGSGDLEERGGVEATEREELTAPVQGNWAGWQPQPPAARAGALTIIHGREEAAAPAHRAQGRRRGLLVTAASLLGLAPSRASPEASLAGERSSIPASVTGRLVASPPVSGASGFVSRAAGGDSSSGGLAFLDGVDLRMAGAAAAVAVAASTSGDGEAQRSAAGVVHGCTAYAAAVEPRQATPAANMAEPRRRGRRRSVDSLLQWLRRVPTSVKELKR